MKCSVKEINVGSFEKCLCKIEKVSFYTKIDKKKFRRTDMNALKINLS